MISDFKVKDMSLNSVVSGERVHIGFFGLRNAGKSSLVNAVTGQRLSLVSDVKGTTTDPVKKAMELLPLGAVVIIDTPGIDDEGSLGEMRVEKAKEILSTVHIAVLVVDSTKGMSKQDEEIKSVIEKRHLPYIIAYNKADLLSIVPKEDDNSIYVSSKLGFGINELKEKISHAIKSQGSAKRLLPQMVNKGDIVVLVTPIDESAPKGRLILPQQQTIRELLDIGATALVVQPEGLKDTLSQLKENPRLVITDSQAFSAVAKILPSDIMLTSFSILFARYKGDLATVVKGAAKLNKLQDGDRVLISEGCTHHRQCGDIGSVKLPKWIREYSKKDITFDFTSGGDFPKDTSAYSLVVHCGGCMLTENEMKNRISICEENGSSITNYGIAIAQTKGILYRSLQCFPKEQKLLD